MPCNILDVNGQERSQGVGGAGRNWLTEAMKMETEITAAV